MTRLWKTATFTALLGVITLLPARADTLEMPSGPPALQDQPAAEHSVTLPGRGMSMSAVEERFGTPRTKHNEVGDPPITRWVYPDFTVYFEHQYVINAVAHDDAGKPTEQ
ncbi:MAG: phosphodiesterase [Thiohalophilus sp.]